MLCRLFIATVVVAAAGVAVRADDLEKGVVGRSSNHRTTLSSRVPRRDVLVRLPPVKAAPTEKSPARVAHGTYREEGSHLVLNLDGREIRLSREDGNAGLEAAEEPSHLLGGTVQGRLVHQGAPLKNCRVALIPMVKAFSGGYRLHRSGPRLVATTGEQGDYQFDTVPPGAYKLTWLPAGTNQWIRRIAMRPDVTAREGETVSAKDVRVALKTLN